MSAIGALKAEGPNLGRPLVDSIKASRHSNMKELRRRSFRILFAFDRGELPFYLWAAARRVSGIGGSSGQSGWRMSSSRSICAGND